jgi:hypothetical protein
MSGIGRKKDSLELVEAERFDFSFSQLLRKLEFYDFASVRFIITAQ